LLYVTYKYILGLTPHIKLIKNLITVPDRFSLWCLSCTRRANTKREVLEKLGGGRGEGGRGGGRGGGGRGEGMEGDEIGNYNGGEDQQPKVMTKTNVLNSTGRSN
jgi:hypothetical protein